MYEEGKKISLLSVLDSILDNDYINTEVKKYCFSHAKMIVINNADYDVSNHHVEIILHLDELIMNIYDNKDVVISNYSLPYSFIDNFHIIIGDD